MHYVYILRSESEPSRHYIGSTNELKRRLADHNGGSCAHTEKFRPWILKSYFAFRSKEVAQRFERYLKSGSGREFARRHFE
ncbi:MAG: GIY-YIG nuclease family protein [Verrucomicrobiota bacterium]